MVPKEGKCFGLPFNIERGATQVNPLSPTIFIILVDAVARAVLLEFCGTQEAHHGFGWAAGENNI